MLNSSVVWHKTGRHHAYATRLVYIAMPFLFLAACNDRPGPVMTPDEVRSTSFAGIHLGMPVNAARAAATRYGAVQDATYFSRNMANKYFPSFALRVTNYQGSSSGLSDMTGPYLLQAYDNGTIINAINVISRYPPLFNRIPTYNLHRKTYSKSYVFSFGSDRLVGLSSSLMSIDECGRKSSQSISTYYPTDNSRYVDSLNNYYKCSDPNNHPFYPYIYYINNNGSSTIKIRQP